MSSGTIFTIVMIVGVVVMLGIMFTIVMFSEKKKKCNDFRRLALQMEGQETIL